MKIVYATSASIPSFAANSIHVMKMAQALANLGHSVTLIAKNGKKNSSFHDPYAFYGVKPNFKLRKFYALPGTVGLMIYAWAVSCMAYLLSADMIYTRCLMSAFIAVYMGHAVIYERHDSFSSQSRLKQRIFEKLIQHKNLKKLVVISQALANHFAAQHGIPVKKMIVAPDGADPVQMDNQPPPFKRHMGRSVAGYIGHLYQGRGIDVILAMAKTLSDVDFHIIGGMPEDITFWKNENNNVNLFFHGHVNPARTSAFMMNCDILLAPYQKKVEVAGGGGDTTQWMSPLKIFEYMSSGKPMICSDLPVLREVLENEETALLCPPDDLAAWQTALQRLIEDPILAEHIGKKAKEKFIEHYTWQKRAALILENIK